MVCSRDFSGAQRKMLPPWVDVENQERDETNRLRQLTTEGDGETAERGESVRGSSLVIQVVLVLGRLQGCGFSR